MINYFGGVLKSEIEDDGEMFECASEPNWAFYHGVEYGTNAGELDEVMIFDTCGREVPICMEHIPSLIKILSYYYGMFEKMTDAACLKEKLSDECVERAVF